MVLVFTTVPNGRGARYSEYQWMEIRQNVNEFLYDDCSTKKVASEWLIATLPVFHFLSLFSKGGDMILSTFFHSYSNNAIIPVTVVGFPSPFQPRLNFHSHRSSNTKGVTNMIFSDFVSRVRPQSLKIVMRTPVLDLSSLKTRVSFESYFEYRRLIGIHLTIIFTSSLTLLFPATRLLSLSNWITDTLSCLVVCRYTHTFKSFTPTP